MYSKIIKNIIFPLYQIKLQPDERYITYINLLEKSQWWSYSELEKLQLKRLKQLLKHANDNVPFYHKMFKKLNFKPTDVKSVNDLNKLPILTKEIINKNYDELYATNYSKEKLIPFTTSGSTGVPMKFYIDKKWEACNMAAAYRAWEWAGYKLGDKMAYLWGAPWDLKDQRKIDKIRNYLLRIIKLNAFNLTDENMVKYAKILLKFKPKIINTYASVIFLFSEFLKKEGIYNIKPDVILTTADMLYNHQRKFIENIFDCEVFDYYSGRDTTLQAAECSEHNGYHLSIENAVVEFVEENEHVSSGETGKIIITDLCNYTMPFIRYEIGDLGSSSDEKCSCGRSLPIMKSLKGRIFDFIITPEGKHIPGEYFHFTIIDHNIHGIKEFQIVQNSIDKLNVYIVKNPNDKNNDVNRFINIIQNEMGEKVEIKLEYVPSIKRTPSGKLRHIISNVNRSNCTFAE
ncbi:MAG: phenylacetate--CoA ligase family protein [Candidatus Thermoplasmatota archaeon]|jgi:phenylacetate-CoA ligase|nr:phenylacetate--CoA ligase family protein [Candidatus Thermoplasmatota archaeon]